MLTASVEKFIKNMAQGSGLTVQRLKERMLYFRVAEWISFQVFDDKHKPVEFSEPEKPDLDWAAEGAVTMQAQAKDMKRQYDILAKRPKPCTE